MALNKTALKNDLLALRQHNEQDAEVAWDKFCTGLVNAIDAFVKTGEYDYVPSPTKLLSTTAGQPVGGTFKVKLT